ncbi:MAG: glyoxylate/hydroxypyruvate reductase A [Xylophilus ampelinus]
MHIAFCCTDVPAQPWLADLRAALPEARIDAWSPGDAPADHAVVWMPPQAFFDAQPRLRSIFNIGAGVDALLKLRLPPGVPLVRIDDGGMAVQMAEYVCHAAIGYFREFGAYAADAVAGRWLPREARDRRDFTVGVLGLGVLGQRVAQALRQFEFPVRGWSRTPKAIEGIDCYAGDDGLDDFLAGTRLLACLLPLTPDTRDILRRETLSKLPRGAYLVNVARGAHLVEDDLLALVDAGHIAGATLDVFREEPLPADHPLRRRPRIAVTPHISAQSLRADCVAQIAAKLRAMGRGEPVAGLVDPARGY